MSLFGFIKEKFIQTKNSLSTGIANLFLGKKEVDESILTELEAYLIQADFGSKLTNEVLIEIKNSISRKQLNDANALKEKLKELLKAKLISIDDNDNNEFSPPKVILVVGINGAGKTTTIGKIANYYKKTNKSVMLAAGDTYRAAAIEQLKHWAEVVKVPVIAQKHGADSASVVFDALQSAKSKNVDVLIADTAGRLHTQDHLMHELAKVNRVLKKIDENAPHETLLILDSTIGQNAISQAREFKKSMHIDGIIMTKMDSTAKGGVIFTIQEELGIPIKFIGCGEGIEDIKIFDKTSFVEDIFAGA